MSPQYSYETIALCVTRAFGDYQVGQYITDQSDVELALMNHSRSVVKVNKPTLAEEPAPSEHPEAVEETSEGAESPLEEHTGY